jgi:hypothetical protein
MTHEDRDPARLRPDAGLSLLEVVIAMGILLVLALGLLPLGVIAVSTTENEGHLVARTTEYAQDKMEQLMALSFSDSTSDTTYFPAPDSGGTGMAEGGSVDPAAPVDGYVDWLAYDGELLHGGVEAPSDWFYQRLWEITPVAAGLKQIKVVATVRAATGGEVVPKSTVVVLKTNKF